MTSADRLIVAIDFGNGLPDKDGAVLTGIAHAFGTTVSFEAGVGDLPRCRRRERESEQEVGGKELGGASISAHSSGLRTLFGKNAP